MVKDRSRAGHASVALVLTTFLAACGGGAPTTALNPDDSVVLTVIVPTDAPIVETSDKSVTLAGTARSDTSIANVVWVNDRGGEGVANGTDDWQIANIKLKLGSNEITITATDYAGMSESANIIVLRESEGTGSVTLSWDAPTQRTDGSPLTNLAGYRIYYGRMSEIYDYSQTVANVGLQTLVIENLVPGDWFFVVAAYDHDNNESDFSSEVIARIE